MTRLGMFGSTAPRRNSLHPNSFLSGLGATPPSNGFLSGLAGTPSSGGFLSRVTGPPKPERSAVAEALAKLMNPPKVIVPDYGVNYTFDVFPIYYRPIRKKSVYIFAQDRRLMFYAGIAEDVFERLTDHERMAEAIEMGANEVWVHTPGPDRIIDYKDAERRLIERHCFPLNKQHNPLAYLFR